MNFYIKLAVTSAGLVLASQAFAVNKCVDSKGRVVYQEAQCPASHDTKPVNISGAGRADPLSPGSQYWARQASEVKRQKEVETAIQAGEIFIGMTADEVVQSWGRPTKINSTITAGSRHEQWVYRRSKHIGGLTQYVYLEDGRVRSMQDSGR